MNAPTTPLGKDPGREQLWVNIHAERRALADDLDGLPEECWVADSLCGDWTVRQTLAHLTAGARETRGKWLTSVLLSGFNFERHNNRQLNEQLGSSPAETLASFRLAIASASAASGHHWAWLGESVIHAEDIRRPLAMASTTPPATAAFLLTRFAAKNFTVPSRTAAEGLRLHATDHETVIGDGPEVAGPSLSLLMAISGRAAHLVDLAGPGLSELQSRIR